MKIIQAIIMVYLIISAPCLLVGIFDGNEPDGRSGCDNAMTPIQYMFVSYRVGCMLNTKYKWYYYDGLVRIQKPFD